MNNIQHETKQHREASHNQYQKFKTGKKMAQKIKRHNPTRKEQFMGDSRTLKSASQ